MIMTSSAIYKLICSSIFIVASYSNVNNNLPDLPTSINHPNHPDHIALYSYALEALDRSDYDTALHQILGALSVLPDDIDTLQLTGSLYLKIGDALAAKHYLSKAITLSDWKVASYIANYIEALRLTGDSTLAIEVGLHGLHSNPTSAEIKYNIATIYANNQMHDKAYALFREITLVQPSHYEAWKRGGSAAIDAGLIDDAIVLIRESLSWFPLDASLTYNLGVAFHTRGDLILALEQYEICRQLDSSYLMVYASIGAAYQGLGFSHNAVEIYENIIPLIPNDAGIMNNFGALLGTMNRHEESLFWLNKAYQIDPTMLHVLINIGSYYQDEVQINKAYFFFNSAIQHHPQESTLLTLRMMLLASPVCSSWSLMNTERNALIGNLTYFSTQLEVKPAILDSSLDRVPFYLSYHGLNDRHIIELLASSYRKAISNLVYINPYIQSISLPIRITDERRIKIGFISKFFGVFEPHGLLLDGVMKYLPRSSFEVICLPVARSDGKPVAGSVRDAADIVINLPLSHHMVQEVVSELQLDILVFADVMSEPMNHFLAHSRLAPIQVAFWGNPITSGSQHIDYFISSHFMEHPYRTRMLVKDEPWTEQIVLLEGQGIWYNRPESPDLQLSQANFTFAKNFEVYNREYFGFNEKWFIYLCPQSVFKMHPLFDYVFRDILTANPNGHVVVTGGRRPSWTKIYTERLLAALGEDIATRLHVISRVSSEKFLGLLEIADVILHPFPFDGSRTSADGLIVGKPVLTMPADHLRGRMGAAFFRTMNIPELVARNRSEYIEIAVNLSLNRTLYDYVSLLIKERTHLVWEDMSVPYEWMRFLSLAAGIKPLSWTHFIQESGRDVTTETALFEQRKINSETFDSKFGPEIWLLENGVASLPSFLTANETPRIFTDWRSEPDEVKYAVKADTLLENILETMEKFIVHQDYSMAVRIGTENIRTCTTSIACLVQLGTSAYFLGNYSIAFEICSQVVATNKEDRAALSCKGLSALYLRKGDNAIKSLLLALKTKEDSSQSIFSIPEETLQENLISAFNSFGRMQECVNAVTFLMQIPPILSGGALLVVFSFVKWKYSRKEELDQLWTSLYGGSLVLYDELIRIQSTFAHLMNHAIACFSEIVPYDLWKSITELLMEKMGSNEDISKTFDHNFTGEIVLLTQYYESNNTNTLADMRTALSHNIQNPYFNSIVLLTESKIDFSFLSDSSKLQQYVIGDRLKFQNAFQYANRYLANKTVILSNADIFFDDTLSVLSRSRDKFPLSTVLALSKWKHEKDGSFSLSLRTDSQDSWVFQAPIRHSVIENSAFILGAPRCDNRLAHILMDADYNVINPVFSIRSIEIHSSIRESNVYSMKGAVRGAGKKVLLTDTLSFAESL